MVYDNKSIEAKQLLGYVPEMPAVYDLLTVEEHLEFIARAFKTRMTNMRRASWIDLNCGIRKAN